MKSLTEKIAAFESNTMNADDTEVFFQEIVTTGVVWKMGSGYESIARAMIAHNVISA